MFIIYYYLLKCSGPLSGHKWVQFYLGIFREGMETSSVIKIRGDYQQVINVVKWPKAHCTREFFHAVITYDLVTTPSHDQIFPCAADYDRVTYDL